MYILLDYGADINAVNACGATPLHDAVVRGNEDIVEELLRAGANTNIQGISAKWAGKTPYDLAQNQPHLSELFDRYNDYDNSNDTQIVPRGNYKIILSFIEKRLLYIILISYCYKYILI